MSSANKLILLGRVGKDPEIKVMESGASVASFSLATSEKYKDRSGQTKEETQWHNLVVWSRGANAGLVGVVERFVKKGTQIYVEGKLTYREYEKDGQKRTFTEIKVSELTLLGGNSGAGNTAQPAQDDEPDGLPF